MADLGRVNIILFKGKECAPCKVVEKNLRNIMKSASGNASLTLIDTDEEEELTEKYNVRNVPVVLYNNKIVLTAQQAAELIGSEQNAFSMFDAGPQQSENPFGVMDMPGQESIGSSDSMNALNFDSMGSGSDIFSSGSSAIFNHLFNSLIEASVESNEEELARWQKFNMLTISQKTMTLEAIQQLTRPSVGDYVHMGVLQSIVTSILAINPASRQYLYNSAKNMGRYGNVQFRFLSANPRMLAQSDPTAKFRDLLEGLQDLYSANSLGLPLFLASRSLVEYTEDKKKARIMVYDSAYAAQMSPIGQPVCHLLAGEIAGLIETTLGEEHVSVIETKCWALGDPFCQFEIELGKDVDFKIQSERPFLTETERERFQNSLNVISKNMYQSSLIRLILRPNPSDYIHISVLQQALNSIKFSDPFFSTLLFYAGFHYGKYGADYETIERIMEKSDLEAPMEFEEACNVLKHYFNDPSTILTRLYGRCELELEDDETAIFRIFESAISSGLDFSSEGAMFELDKEKATLCDYTAGFIKGRLSRLIEDDIEVEETACHSLGSEFCEFRVELD